MKHWPLLLLFLITNVLASDMQCKMELVSESPLLVTDATDMGKRDFENFRERKIPSDNSVTHFITKRSIVRLIRPVGRGENYANVEVLGEAKVNEARASGHNAENARLKNVPQAKRGLKGFIHKDSLQASDNYVFIVAKDSPFVALPSPYDEANAFRLAKNGSKYKVTRCCEENECFDYPLFEVLLQGSWKSVEDESINTQVYCKVTTSTRPVEKHQYEAMLNILKHPGLGLSAGFLPGDRTQGQADDLYFVDGRGLVMLPHVLATSGVNMTEGPYGSYHYTGGGQDTQGDDAYLAPYAACGFMAVMREWNRRYPDCAGKGCGIAWGNCSHSTHVAGVGRKWPSKTHGHGHCIDIRLFTKTNSSVSTAVGSRIYNRNRVVEFLQLSRAAGATTIYLEDSAAARQVHKQNGSGFPPVLTRVPPHKDHMHVCFSHRPTDRRSSFADPLSPATNSRLKQVCETDAEDALIGRASKLLGTDVVATAGQKTPDFIPIPKPRPDRATDLAQNAASETIETQPKAIAEPEDLALPSENIPIPIPRPNREPIEVTVLPPQEEATPVAEATPALPADRPLTVEDEAEIAEVVPTPDDDPFKEDEVLPTVEEVIEEEVRQAALSAEEAEKYYGDDKTEISEQVAEQVVEGDYVENKPVPVEILPPPALEETTPVDESDYEEDEASLELMIQEEAHIERAPVANAYAPESSDDSASNPLTSSRRPERRPAHIEQKDEFEQAVDGAYEPVATKDEGSTGFGFFSFLNGIWEFLAGMFSFLF